MGKFTFFFSFKNHYIVFELRKWHNFKVFKVQHFEATAHLRFHWGVELPPCPERNLGEIKETGKEKVP